MSEWDGKDRRQDSKDHDLLTRIDANLRNFIDRFGEHILDDNKRFKEHSEKIEFQQKVFYGCLGVVVFIEFISKFVH